MASGRGRSSARSAAVEDPPAEPEHASPNVDEHAALFAPDDDNVVRGEVIVRLTSAGLSSLAASVPTGPLSSGALARVTQLGIGGLDDVLARHGVVAVTRLHPPLPQWTSALSSSQALSETLRVRLDANADVQGVVAELLAHDAVQAAEPSRWREATTAPNDPQYVTQWGLARIGCPAAWTITQGHPSVIVAVLDSGADIDHPELAARLVPGQDMVDLPGAVAPAGWRFEGDWITRDDVPQDEVGHGTHVAGTIGCGSNDGVGVAGVTWSCSLMPVKVLTRLAEINGTRVRGIGSSADIAAGIRWAVDHGARIINMSLGSSQSTFVEQEAIQYAIDRGVVVVAAMGNSGSSTPSYPAAYPGVIAVGATDASDTLAAFSNTGGHISLVAPGVDVLSTDWNDTYSTKSGTSMASPHVAGVAALVLAANPTLTAAEVRQILEETAEPLRDAPSDSVPNARYGHGLVNAAAAVLRALDPATPLPPTPQPTDPTMTIPNTLPPFTRPLTLPPFTRPLTLPPFTRPLTLTPPTLTRPTLTRPTLTRPTLPTVTRPTLPTFTRPTLTRPTLPTVTRPTLPTVTRPTLTRPTLPTVTRPTLPTTLTRPTLTRPTLPTLTRPTLTRPTLTRPTLPTLTRPTLTRPTLTRPTLTRPTLTFTRPTLTFTRPTLTFTRPTLTLTRPTLTVTRPTLTITRPPITQGTLPGPGPFAAGADAYADPYADYYADSSYGAYDPYAGAEDYTSYDAYGSGYDAYGSGSYDAYGSGAYDAYADPYAGGYDPYAGVGYEQAPDPYGYDAYADPYDPNGYASAGAYGYDDGSGYGSDVNATYDPYGTAAGYDAYGAAGYDPYDTSAYDAYGASAYDPYGTGAYDAYGASPYDTSAYDPYGY